MILLFKLCCRVGSSGRLFNFDFYVGLYSADRISVPLYAMTILRNPTQ